MKSAQCEHFKQVLKHELARRIHQNPRYSLRSFAKALRVSPGTLSLIFSGQRVPSTKLAQTLTKALDLSPDDRAAFEASLSASHSRRGLKRKNAFAKNSAMLPATTQVDHLQIDLFEIIADWYHYAIMMLLEIPGARVDARWIAKQLEISPSEAQLAIDRLFAAHLIIRKKDRYTIDSSYLTTADKSVTTPALRRHQRQILEKAIQSLENDPIETRNMNSLTMAIDPSRLPKAKLMIEEFNQKLCAFLEGGKRSQVFEFGTYLFPLQRKENGE
jgi:uncharacterized protein (TIGR02147 family)